MTSGLSLAHKCQILFGLAIVLLLTAALSVPWFRVAALVEETQRENCEQVAELWLTWALSEVSPSVDSPEAVLEQLSRKLAEEGESASDPSTEGSGEGDRQHPPPPSRAPSLRIIPRTAFGESPNLDPLASAARRQFEQDRELVHLSSSQRDDAGEPLFRYVRALRQRDLTRWAPTDEAAEAGDLVGLLLVEQSAGRVAGLLLVDRMYIIATGLAAGALASLAFYWITTRLILSPVRVLRDITERVREGELLVRSDLRTRDEFEQLSDTFNGMLIAFKEQQDNLRAANTSLDNRLTELAQMNIDLYESATLKGEFLASISHELRTPLNSIIGFAELLQEIAEHEIPREEQTPEQTKRFRYISNIVASGRSLLDMINELLEMAKLEAGKVELRVQTTNVGELCDLLAGLVRPQARKKKLKLTTRIDPELPLVETDASRLRQIIFNFVSNAIKFTPEHGAVEVWAAAETHPAAEGEALGRRYVRLGISDRGPGIPPDMQHIVFEKFRQIDAGPTRGYSGTGLGLAICKELAALLHARIEVVTQAEKGSCFMLRIPTDFDPEEEMDGIVAFLAGNPHEMRPSDVEAKSVRSTEEQELADL